MPRLSGGTRDYTRLLRYPLQPLWGVGVVSVIDVIVKPAACSARTGDSLPDPGPEIWTERTVIPCSMAFLAQSSAATWAAKGVALRDPLNPAAPADDQAIALPCSSVIVTIVLLKEEEMWATPEAIFLRLRRVMRVVSLAIVNSRSFLGVRSGCVPA